MTHAPRHCLFLITLALLFGACGGEPSAEWTEVAEDALSDPQQKQRARAFQARDAMFGALSGRLMKAMGEGGPAAAIQVCRKEAPVIAKQVGEAESVAISRTSFQLRNPRNAPPAWAAAYVEDRREANTYAAHPDGRLGVLLPIRVQNACLACHGPADALRDEVAEALTGQYPEDAATGFGQGDLRGYFVIVVPPR